jgi:hypothetical protein
MKSLIATVTAILALAVITAPALARPADNGPQTVVRSDRVEPVPAAPDGGTATIVYVLIGLGAAVTLGGAAVWGARAVIASPRRP